MESIKNTIFDMDVCCLETSQPLSFPNLHWEKRNPAKNGVCSLHSIENLWEQKNRWKIYSKTTLVRMVFLLSHFLFHLSFINSYQNMSFTLLSLSPIFDRFNFSFSSEIGLKKNSCYFSVVIDLLLKTISHLSIPSPFGPRNCSFYY